MSEYRETLYTCPTCGKAIYFRELAEYLEPPLPYLICPFCGLTSYLTDEQERFLLQNYCQTRKATRELLLHRIAEGEGKL